MPAVSRFGDILATGHGCDSLAPLLTPLQSTVRVNGILASVVGTPVAPHTITNPSPPPVCIPHLNQILNSGSATVRIQGIPVGRIGDSADQGFMLTGSPNVNAG